MWIVVLLAYVTQMPITGYDGDSSATITKSIRPIVVLPSDLKVKRTSLGVFDLVQ